MRGIVTVDLDCERCGGTGHESADLPGCACTRILCLDAIPGLRKCPSCEGSGRAYREERDCTWCDGLGVVAGATGEEER